jgi:SlyX protein
MNEASLEQLQSKIAYLERAVVELSDMVFRQHQEIQALQAHIKAFRERLDGAALAEATGAPEQERPPHY